MKIDEQARAALQQPDTKVVAIEMTPERKERYQRASGLIVDTLKANTNGPVEAYILLKCVIAGFEEAYGIRGGIIVGHEEGHS
jgi:hypothetical protein